MVKINFKKIFIGVVVALLFVNSQMVSAEYDLQNVTWDNPDVQLSQYQDLYIMNIDMRNFYVKQYDDDEQEYYIENFDQDFMNDIALEFYLKLTNRLKEVIPINKQQEVDKSIKSLVLDIQISAIFEREEYGLITQKFIPKNDASTLVKFGCQLKDGQENKILLTASDKQNFETNVFEDIFSQDKEIKAFSNLLDQWARRLTFVISIQKNKRFKK